MANPKRLQPGQLIPAAKPVSAFLQFRNQEPAAPAKPVSMPTAQGVTMIQRGSVANVQGYNSAQELAEALKPLGNIIDQGSKLYFTNEMKKAQNEMLKAIGNINRDQLYSADIQAQQNKALSRVNPAAALLADELYPYRKKVMEKTLSRWLAGQAPTAFKIGWDKFGGHLSTLDSGDAQITKAEAEIINGLIGPFNLDETSAGYIDLLFPALEREREKFRNNQIKGAVAYDKYSLHLLLSSEIQAITTKVDFSNDESRQEATARLTGVGLIDETGAPTPLAWKLGTKNQPLRPEQAVIPFHRAKYGKHGEGPKVVEKAYRNVNIQLLSMLEDDAYKDRHDQIRGALQFMRQLPVDDLPKNPLTGGYSTVNDLLAYDLLVDEEKLLKRRVSINKLNQDVFKRDAYALAAELGIFDLGVGTKEWNSVLQQVQEKFPAMTTETFNELSKKLKDDNEENKDITANTDGVYDVLNKWEGMIGSDWDVGKFDEEFEAVLATFPKGSGKLKNDLIRQATALKNRKQQEINAAIDKSEFNKNLTSALKNILTNRYPGETAAILQGKNVADLLAYGDEAKQEGSRNFASKFKQRYTAALLETYTNPEKRNGQPHDAMSMAQIADEVYKEMTGDKELMNSLFPTPTEVKKRSIPEGGNIQIKQDLPTFSQGKAIPDKRLELYRSHAVYDAPTVLNLTEMLLNDPSGQSLPSTVRGAAKRLGITPAEYVRSQADLYERANPGKEWFLEDNQWQEIIRKNKEVSSIETGIRVTTQTIKRSPSKLSFSANAMVNVLLGIAPVHASEQEIPILPPIFPRYVAVDDSRLSGLSPDGNTQTLHGIIGAPGYDVHHGVGNDHIHHQAKDKRSAFAVADFLKSKGLPITEFLQTGPVAPVHSEKGGHYDGTAFDVPVGVEEHRRVLTLLDQFYHLYPQYK